MTKRMIAITSTMWMSAPSDLKASRPTSQRMSRMAAIVRSIGFPLGPLNTRPGAQRLPCRTRNGPLGGRFRASVRILRLDVGEPVLRRIAALHRHLLAAQAVADVLERAFDGYLHVAE